jgi:hypothetical protein
MGRLSNDAGQLAHQNLKDKEMKETKNRRNTKRSK